MRALGFTAHDHTWHKTCRVCASDVTFAILGMAPSWCFSQEEDEEEKHRETPARNTLSSGIEKTEFPRDFLYFI